MMKLSSIHNFLFILILGICVSTASQAQVVVTQTQALSFCTFAFVSFNDVLRVNIRNNGTTNPNANAIVITPGSRGEFDLDAGLANANSVYTVTTPVTAMLTGPGANFMIDNFRVRPNTLRTNAVGFDQFRIAARLRSMGAGMQYGNGLYNQDLTVIIAF
jgi:hypothetical protein